MTFLDHFFSFQISDPDYPMVSAGDVAAQCLARALGEEGVFLTGKFNLRFLQTPNVPHASDAGHLFEKIAARFYLPPSSSSINVCGTVRVREAVTQSRSAWSKRWTASSRKGFTSREYPSLK